MFLRPLLRFLLALALAAAPSFAQELAGCPMLPKNNIWNTPIDTMPVHPSSTAYVATSGIDRNLHPDFGGAGGGIPITVVPATQPMVQIIFDEGAANSDPGPYPIPPNVAIEGGTDGHALVLQQGTCKLYEVLAIKPAANGSWTGYSGAVFDLRSNQLRPDGWTSSDAAGLPVAPGLIRFDEILAGEIRHALRLTVPKTRREFIWPARHYASRSDDQAMPPMGQRFRLKAGYNISGFDPKVQVLLRALKKYGMILADNGSSWFLTGATDTRWEQELWSQIKVIKGADLEAVDVSSLMISPNSGQAGTLSTVGRQDVPFSPTPVFDAQAGPAMSIKLTGDVTGASVVNLLDGVQVAFLICQDDQGSRAFTWPANVSGGMRVGATARTCSAQQFVSDGKGLYATSPGATDLPIVP
jgi:hypothetical protein